MLFFELSFNAYQKDEYRSTKVRMHWGGIENGEMKFFIYEIFPNVLSHFESFCVIHDVTESGMENYYAKTLLSIVTKFSVQFHCIIKIFWARYDSLYVNVKGWKKLTKKSIFYLNFVICYYFTARIINFDNSNQPDGIPTFLALSTCFRRTSDKFTQLSFEFKKISFTMEKNKSVSNFQKRRQIYGFENYRGIVNLCNFSKVFETIL